ncbi:MAG: 3-methylcrotonyl-CoA carboxylase alpha subunit [Myxococcota bacterium]
MVGVSSNINFLSRLITHDRFARGEFDTGLIEDDEGSLLSPSAGPSVRARLCGALAIALSDAACVTTPPHEPDSPWSTLGAWRLNELAQKEISLRVDDELLGISVEHGADEFRMTIDGNDYAVRGELGEEGRLDASIDGHRIVAWTVRDGDFLHIFLDNESTRFEIVDPLRMSSRQADSMGGLQAPMPGTVLQLLVEPGTEVEQGTPLLVLEAMKMEHTVRAPSAGRVKSFRYAVGDQVTDGADLLDFEADD